MCTWHGLEHDPSIIFITELQPCPKDKNYCGFSKVCLVDPLFPDLCSGKSVVLDSLILGDSPQRYDANYCGTVTVPYPHERQTPPLGSTSPTLFEQQLIKVLLCPVPIDKKR